MKNGNDHFQVDASLLKEKIQQKTDSWIREYILYGKEQKKDIFPIIATTGIYFDPDRRQQVRGRREETNKIIDHH